MYYYIQLNFIYNLFKSLPLVLQLRVNPEKKCLRSAVVFASNKFTLKSQIVLFKSEKNKLKFYASATIKLFVIPIPNYKINFNPRITLL